MILDVLYFLGLVMFFLYLFAELGKLPFFGLVASFILLLTGYLLVMDPVGLQIKTGELTLDHHVTVGLQECNCSLQEFLDPRDPSGQTVISGNFSTLILDEWSNDSTVDTYSSVSPTVIFSVDSILGLFAILSGMYGAIVYAGKITAKSSAKA